MQCWSWWLHAICAPQFRKRILPDVRNCRRMWPNLCTPSKTYRMKTEVNLYKANINFLKKLIQIERCNMVISGLLLWIYVFRHHYFNIFCKMFMDNCDKGPNLSKLVDLIPSMLPFRWHQHELILQLQEFIKIVCLCFFVLRHFYMKDILQTCLQTYHNLLLLNRYSQTHLFYRMSV